MREDEETVKRLVAELGAGGVEVWLDRDRLIPGETWQVAIREAIESGTRFIACFSEGYAKRQRSYMNEELVIAIDELRKRPDELRRCDAQHRRSI